MLQFRELSYANDSQPFFKRWLIRAVEGFSGRDQFCSVYCAWRDQIVPTGERVFAGILELTGIGLDVEESWPPSTLPAGPLVIIANHPFGIGDGVAVLAMVEKLGRPFKILIHNDLLKVKEMEPYALPISFDDTKKAVALNLATRNEAKRLLKAGSVIVIFPAGGVATAPKGFGRAVDLPWKMFVARLVESAHASVIPVYFSGQNGWLFHAVSRFSLTLRLSLLVREFKQLRGKSIKAKCGQVISWNELSIYDDRQLLLKRLQDAVVGLEHS